MNPLLNRLLDLINKAVYKSIRFLIVLSLIGSYAFICLSSAFAQDEVDKAVQELSGYYSDRRSLVYNLINLKQGDRLYIYMQRTSGNLDPIIAIVGPGTEIPSLADVVIPQIEREVASGRDPIIVVEEVLDEVLLDWDDDRGEGYDAALEYIVPADGTYRLIAGGTPIKNTFGDFRLLVGVNSPEILSGKASSTGDSFVILDRSESRTNIGVQEITSTLTQERTKRTYSIHQIEAGETLYVYLEGIAGDLQPVVILEDFGQKPLRSGNFTGQDTSASFEYHFEEPINNGRLVISSGTKDGVRTTGDYRLLVGLNAPEVLDGEAEPSGQPVVHDVIDVEVGIQLDQIAGVDQKAENYDVVANLIFSWQDPDLAFSPDSCECYSKLFTVSEFVEWTVDNGNRWPEFILFNQQGNRWSQNELVSVNPEGEATYFERFSVTLQAPDFNFRKFPFDSQDFYIRIQSLYSDDVYVYKDLVGASNLGSQLGEEEWQVTDFDTIIETVENLGERAQFSYHFNAKRALTFYLIRLFIPLTLIILVAWITFFLKNYTRRIEITTGNLLLFIAFNFTISDNIPRLGYLTFLDVILACTFAISVVVVAFNVYLRRLEVNGKEDLALRIDQYTIWIYPLAFIVTFGIVYAYFFLWV